MMMIGYGQAAAAGGSATLVRTKLFGDATFSSTSTFTMPTAITSGNKIIVAAATSSQGSPSTPSGWTLVAQDTSSVGFYIWQKTSDGTEGGTSFTITGSATNRACFLFAEASGVTAIEATIAALTADPPSHTPAANAPIWIALTSCTRTDRTITAGPSGYTATDDGLSVETSPGQTSNNHTTLGAAYLVSTKASEDPGAFTYTNTPGNVHGATISIS